MVGIAERLQRRDDGGFTGVNTHRVNVLHRTNDGSVVGLVPHDLIFEFLPAKNGFLNQDLGNSRITKTQLRDFNQLPHVPSRSTAQAPQRERRSNEYRPTADQLGSSDDLVNGIAGHGLADGEVDGFTDLIEQFTVFCFVNGVQI